MATQISAAATAARSGRANVARFAIAGALASVGFFVLCWLGQLIPFTSPTHAYIALFTPKDMASTAALLEGGFWSLAFGLVGGALVALGYNLTGFLERR